MHARDRLLTFALNGSAEPRFNVVVDMFARRASDGALQYVAGRTDARTLEVVVSVLDARMSLCDGEPHFVPGTGRKVTQRCLQSLPDAILTMLVVMDYVITHTIFHGKLDTK